MENAESDSTNNMEEDNQEDDTANDAANEVEDLITRSKAVEIEAENEASSILARIEDIRMIAQESYDQAEAAKVMGNQCFRNGDFEAAVQHYNTAIGFNPAEPAYIGNRAACHMAMENYLLALHDAVVVTRVIPNWAKGYYRLSMARMKLGRYADGAAAAREGLSYDPSAKSLKHVFEMCIRDDADFDCEVAATSTWEELLIDSDNETLVYLFQAYVNEGKRRYEEEKERKRLEREQRRAGGEGPFL